MIFCKALWKFLQDDMQEEPSVGWNISPTYGPVYLLQEKHSQQLKQKKDMGNDGHYFVTASNITVAYTRCWEWQKGFKGDPAAKERRSTTMLQSLPQAVAAAMDARRDLGRNEAGALPGGELISDDVQASITNNSFEDIMDVIRNERHYSDISAEDVMRCIPRGLILHPTKTGWLSCREHLVRLANLDDFVPFWHGVGLIFERRPWDRVNHVVDSHGTLVLHLRRPSCGGGALEGGEGAAEDAARGSAGTGLKVSEQLRVWQDRIRILKKPPWVFAPLNLCKTIENTTWAEAMSARPVMGTDGLLTIAIGEGSTYKVLPKITSYFGIVAALFKKMWDQPEMHETLETDDNFEIVASTIKAIYDQTCRSCGVINRLIIYMKKEDKQVRKMRIDHEVGDTPAKLKLLRLKPADKRQSEDTGPVSDKRQKDDRANTHQAWDESSWWHSSDWQSSSSSSWRWHR
ncbi:unnamed protein product [Symbiodinium sp. KB8]|nr:unnamed protein product [Symbiodinium sp. KB8]